jgi:transposase-like protein
MTKNGTVRYRCIYCNLSKTNKRPKAHLKVTLRLFKDYLAESVSRKYLSKINEISRTTLWRMFIPLLDTRPLPLTTRVSKVKIIAVDGFYVSYPCLKRNRHKDGFNRNKCILLWAIDCKTHKPIYWQFYDDIENMGIWKKFIKEMKSHKFRPDYLVSDGHPGITNACSRYWPNTKQQRCLAHFMGNMNKDLSISPKTEIAKELKRLTASLFSVNSVANKLIWEQQWQDYLERYRATITSISSRTDTYENSIRIPKGYVSALSVINNSYKRDEIFLYLDDPDIPNTSNLIESVNGVLRELVRRHRGLSIEKRKNILAWDLAFRQEQTREQLKKQMQKVTKKRHTF